MRNFFSNLKYRMQQSMQGRYGSDEFNRFLSIAALVLIIASLFGRLWAPLLYLYWPGLAVIVYMIFRTMSRNYTARSKERSFYLKVRNKVTGFFRLQKRRAKEGRTHVFYKCPSCRTTIRVPRGRGRIEITCPKCRTKFIKRT